MSLAGGTTGIPRQSLILRDLNAAEILCMSCDDKSVRNESGNLEDDEYFGIFSVGPAVAMCSAASSGPGQVRGEVWM